MHLIRRFVAAVALFGGVVAALPVAVGAQTVAEATVEVQRVVDRLERLSDEAVRLGEEYEQSLADLDEVNAELAALEIDAARLEERIGTLQIAVGDLALERFVAGDQVGGLGTLLVGTDGPTQLMERDSYAGLVSSEAVGSIDTLDAANNDLAKIRLQQEQAQVRLKRTIKNSKAQLAAVEAATAEFEQLKIDAEARLGEAVVRAERERREAEAERVAAATKAADAARRAEAKARNNPPPTSPTPVTDPPGRGGGVPGGQSNPPPPSQPQPAPPQTDPTQPGPPPTAGEPRADDPEPAPQPQPDPEPAPEPEPEPEPEQPKPGRDVPPPSPGAAGAVEAAMSQLGVPYRYAAASPGVAFDCSGLTMWAWGQAGVSLPHYSKAQFEQLPHVPADQAQPGDLIFYRNPVGHVAMYIGNGQMIHAPRTGDVVKIATVNWDKVRDGIVGRPG